MNPTLKPLKDFADKLAAAFESDEAKAIRDDVLERLQNRLDSLGRGGPEAPDFSVFARGNHEHDRLRNN